MTKFTDMLKTYHLQVKSVERLEGDHCLLRLSYPEGLRWQPAAYARFVLPNPPSPKDKERALTLATLPDENEIVVLFKNGPQSSPYKQALSALPPDQKLTMRYLYVNTTLDHQKKVQVFFSCGLGIAATRPLVKSLLGTNSQLFILQLSQQCDVYHEELSHWSQDYPPLHYRRFEEPSSSLQALADLADQYGQEAAYYLIGQPEQVKETYHLLKDKGISRKSIKREPFKGLT